jgi:hypothetical protein
MGGSYFPVVPKPPFWHLDAGGWEPSTASEADIRMWVKHPKLSEKRGKETTFPAHLRLVCVLTFRQLERLNDRTMIRTCFQRICFLLVALALVIGLPLPMDGLQSINVMPQSALAAPAKGPPCNDCECCGDDGTVNTSTCVIGCGGMVASLPDAKVSDVTVSAVSFAKAPNHHAGCSIAPDPSPPRFTILT